MAKRFAVSARTVERYWERYEEEGHCRAKQIGGYRRARLADHQKVLTSWIEKQPDLTLEELVARCQKELQVTLSISGLWHRLKAFGLSYKKRCAPPSRIVLT